MVERNRLVRAQLQESGVDLDEVRRWNDSALDLELGMDLETDEEAVQAAVLATLAEEADDD